ncbi:MAG: prepilin peptidase [Dehalococcoidia bacterium]
MTALEIALFALLGLAVGSFLNLCIDRLPLGRSIISPPSHCDACQQRLKAQHLVPLFSYLWLRGRCRYCGAHIPRRLPLVELATALLFAFLSWQYGLSLQLGMALVYGSLFLLIFVIDLEHGLVLNNLVYPGMALAFVFSFFWPELGVVRALLGGVIGFGLMLIPYLISRGGMGGGDVKLAGLIGLATGFPLIFLALFLGILSGGIVAIALLISGVKSRKEPIPFGPFLAAAAMVTLIWGPAMYQWYIGLL